MTRPHTSLIQSLIGLFIHHSVAMIGLALVGIAAGQAAPVEASIERSPTNSGDIPQVSLHLGPAAGRVSAIAINRAASAAPQPSGSTAFERLLAQSIEAATDGTGSVVTQTESTFNITGGTQTGANLFHSFEQLELNAGQVANFISNPAIQNILSRVVGGDPSIINGLLQVTGGNANLFLMNPAGIVFGPNAQVIVPGAFTATTANGIQIGDEWFTALGSNDYVNLVGEPTGFAFVEEQSGAVVNTGNLRIAEGESVTLVGGTVVNLGTISAPGGDITIAAVPGERLIRISQEGSLISLDLPIAMEEYEGSVQPVSIPDLLAPLSGGGNEQNLAWVTDGDSIRLASTGAHLPTQRGSSTIAGTVDASSNSGRGGTVDLVGKQVTLTEATVMASGSTGGGQVRIGGDYQGQGTIPSAENTLVSSDSTIESNADTLGDGGRVIVWADDSTRFYGDISAQGGRVSGDGGFVEISGHENLAFDGQVDVTATDGTNGTLLLDPRNIFIIRNPFAPNSGEINDGVIGTGDGGNSVFIISAEALERQTGSIHLEASENIVVAPGISLSFQNISQIIFDADNDLNGSGVFSMDSREGINASIATVSIHAGAVRAGSISSNHLEITARSGDITIGDITSGRVSVVNEYERGNITAGRIVSSASFVNDDFSPGIRFAAQQGDINLESIYAVPSDANTMLEDLARGKFSSPPILISIITNGIINIEGVANQADNLSIEVDLTAGNLGIFEPISSPRGFDFVIWDEIINTFSTGLDIKGGTQIRGEFSFRQRITNVDGEPIFSTIADSISQKIELASNIDNPRTANPANPISEIPIPDVPIPNVPVPENPKAEIPNSENFIPENSNPEISGPNNNSENPEAPDNSDEANTETDPASDTENTLDSAENLDSTQPLEDAEDLNEEGVDCDAFRSSDVLDISSTVPEECLSLQPLLFN